MKDKDLLNENGWSLDCESPLNISHEDGTMATNFAARLVIDHLREELEEEIITVENLREYGFGEEEDEDSILWKKGQLYIKQDGDRITFHVLDVFHDVIDITMTHGKLKDLNRVFNDDEL